LRVAGSRDRDVYFDVIDRFLLLLVCASVLVRSRLDLKFEIGNLYGGVIAAALAEQSALPRKNFATLGAKFFRVLKEG